MESPATVQLRDRRAIATSIAVHLCALALFAELARPVLRPPADVLESPGVFTISVVRRPPAPRPHVERITIAAAPIAVPRRASAVRAPAPPTARSTPAPERPVTALARARAGTSLIRRAVKAPAAPVTLAIVATPPPTPAVTAAPATQPPAPEATAPPTAAPTAAAAAIAADGGLFGKNYRAIPNPPSALAAIRARLAGHVHIRVRVDEAGHATDVRFITPVGDAAVAEDVRSKLLAMRYVPADCNGLPCSDDLDIVY